MLPAGPCDDRKMGGLKTNVLIACVCQCIVCPCEGVHVHCALARRWPVSRRRFSSCGGERSSAFASLCKVRAGLDVRVKTEDGKEGGRRMGRWEESHQSPCGWGGRALGNGVLAKTLNCSLFCLRTKHKIIPAFLKHSRRGTLEEDAAFPLVLRHAEVERESAVNLTNEFDCKLN